MIDFRLDPITRDLVLPLRPIDGAERVAQAVGIRLRTWLGDWFLDTSHGVPYLERVFGKAPRNEIIEAVLRSQILTVAGVKQIRAFSLDIDPITRVAKVDCEIDSAEGIVKVDFAISI